MRRPQLRQLAAVTAGALLLSALPTRAVSADVAVVSTGVADSGGPSISADGRWIVVSGDADGRRSVYRIDRESDVTTELSPLPAGVRAGDTIFPRLSADGCVVVAITEIAFDLFRDDDRDERWDVYRLVVPECGGQPNGWELVSSSERSGIALDGVFTESAPALSGSGAVVAYVHQAPGMPDGVGTISVVDITKPVGEPGRVDRVAGMPVESPGGAHTYRGAGQPALSQNGRHLAFVSDATASARLPGWGDGPLPGGPATSQVYVWDRGAEDQRTAVHLVSGRNGQLSASGGDAPAMSEDGRIIVFTSRDRTLVPASLPKCFLTCPTQVYRFDRDTDGNGIFDEAPRATPLALVSAVDAGMVRFGVPVAGDASSWSPAVNADGSQIAFVTDATNLLPSRRAGGGTDGDGDLIVAEFELGQLRRVLDDPELTSVPGAHGQPALSKTGEVIAFETMAGMRLDESGRSSTSRSIATVEVTPQLSLAELDFGTVLLGFTSAELYATVLNAGPAAFEPSTVESSEPNFAITGGTCVRGVIVAAGESCSVNMTFNPTEPRGYSATLTVTGRGPGSPTVSTTIRGAAGEPTLLADPGGVDVDAGVVGDVGGRVAVDIDNVGFLPTSVARINLGGAHPGDFEVVTQSCTNRALNPDASCTIEVEFRPTDAGYRSALLIVTTPIGQYTSAVIGGFGRYEPTFGTEHPVVQPGTDIGIGGNGFPAESPVAIGFDDGSPPFATVTTDALGSFLARVVLPARLRVGERRLVASAEGGAVASVPIELERRSDVPRTWLPGFGMG
ncbi:MAG: choice-of-anchor D domain-containing protein [Ilumatobacter sp.]|uniref:choice-of-anchor D domain-containing protein n=1 Tax=Ilumatobacter sp. TaxID=1967498 RepID=UPI00260BC0BA|nr:choice-of-anchor D domain-containing protein [Ilumatobacter sp.]MDJ0767405.1 choice-of-anchor D domain-containing protein [Ilumatobacter sp.]